MHRALKVLEIIQLILSSGVGLTTIRDAALTCRLWKDPALDQLWKDLDSAFPLLWVLVPLRVNDQVPRDKKTTWTLNAPFPLPEDWDRFETYARRVRTLNFDISPTTGNAFLLSTFQTIVQFRPSGKDLLPNLHKFTFNARRGLQSDILPILLLFLSSSIVEMELRDVIPGGMASFLAYLVLRVPQMQSLKIGGYHPPNTASAALASHLTALERLKRLDVSFAPLTPAIWDAMGQHPCLERASFLPMAWGEVPTTINFQSGAFDRLELLNIRASFKFLCSLFQSQDNLPALKRVGFEGGPMEQGRSEFRRLCDLLVMKIPNLNAVQLRYYSNDLEDNEALGLGDFRPLLQCKTIRHFHVDHRRGVSLTVSEVSELLAAWPNISSLALQYAPYDLDPRGFIRGIKWTPPSLPLSVLETVAEKCPHIKELRLVLDATLPINKTPRSGQHQFERLRKLNVSLSTVGEPSKVASYLAQRSKKRFTLKYDLPRNLQEDVRPRIEQEKEKWNQIGEHLAMLYDQKERLEEDFRLQMQEERARHAQELREVVALCASQDE